MFSGSYGAGDLRYSAVAKHKTLNQEFKVSNIDLVNQVVKCEGKAQKKDCLYCTALLSSGYGQPEEICDEPAFKLNDVELAIKVDGKELKV